MRIMRMRRAARAGLVTAALAAFPHGTVAGEDGAAPAPPAAASPLDAEVDAVRRLVATKLWKAGKASIDKLFAAHADDPAVIAYLPALESDLMRCLFRLGTKDLTPLELLGRGATKYEPNTGNSEFRVSGFSESAGWIVDDDLKVFDVAFDRELSIELGGDDLKRRVWLFGFDPETKGGFAITQGMDKYNVGAVAKLLRIDPGAAAVELGATDFLAFGAERDTVRVSLKDGRVTLTLDHGKGWVVGDRRSQVSASAGKYTRGYVATKGDGDSAPVFTIKGKMDVVFAKRQIAEADARRFREWQAKSWNREAALPKWVVEEERASRGWLGMHPQAVPAAAVPAFSELQRAAFEEPEAAKAVSPGVQSGTSGAWWSALKAYAEGRYADAEAAALKVVEAEPQFGPAHAVLGRARLARGDAEGALFECAKCVELAPAYAPSHDGVALVAFRAGDLDQLAAALRAAAKARAASLLTADLRQALLRLRRGPDWKKTFESRTAKVFVTSDLSFAVCTDVGRTIEECSDVYAKTFRVRPKPTRARVRVFSGFASYADYVDEIGGNPSGTAGVYLPAVRELCVWLHEDRVELSNTIRHEAFHQYLHDFIEHPPIWFNEGYAEYFGFSRRKHNQAVVGQVDQEQAAAAKSLLAKFTPLEEFFLLAPREFMAKANVHYVQAWTVIHLLRAPREAALAGVLDRYFDALLAGRSQREAFDQVLAPVLPVLRGALERHVKQL